MITFTFLQDTGAATKSCVFSWTGFYAPGTSTLFLWDDFVVFLWDDFVVFLWDDLVVFLWDHFVVFLWDHFVVFLWDHFVVFLWDDLVVKLVSLDRGSRPDRRGLGSNSI